MPRVVEGYYRCLAPFTVTDEALGEQYPIVVGGHAGSLTLPSRIGVTTHHVGMEAPDWFYGGDVDLPQSRLAGAEEFWGAAALWHADNTPFAFHVRRFRLSFGIDGADGAVERLAREVAVAMPAWWAQVSVWLEVLFEQDLSRLGPVDPGVHFNTTTLWARLDRAIGGLMPVGGTAARFNMVRYSPADAAGLRRCIALAEASELPEREWQTLRDARSFFNGYDFRRAVLDAGLAAEHAIRRMLSAALVADEREEAEIAKATRLPLGRLCEAWLKRGGTLPVETFARLVQRRNAAAHAGASIAREDAKDALSVALEIVNVAVPHSR
ncbi:hypothetical protein BH09ACT8_BH09ACT8_53050 [soil metagenome]|jgi:hypothetical protein